MLVSASAAISATPLPIGGCREIDADEFRVWQRRGHRNQVAAGRTAQLEDTATVHRQRARDRTATLLSRDGRVRQRKREIRIRQFLVAVVQRGKSCVRSGQIVMVEGVPASTAIGNAKTRNGSSGRLRSLPGQSLPHKVPLSFWRGIGVKARKARQGRQACDRRQHRCATQAAKTRSVATTPAGTRQRTGVAVRVCR